MTRRSLLSDATLNFIDRLGVEWVTTSGPCAPGSRGGWRSAAGQIQGILRQL